MRKCGLFMRGRWGLKGMLGLGVNVGRHSLSLRWLH